MGRREGLKNLSTCAELGPATGPEITNTTRMIILLTRFGITASPKPFYLELVLRTTEEVIGDSKCSDASS